MALFNCPECKHQISDKSDVCIHCGFPIKPVKTQNMAQPKVVTVEQTSKEIKKKMIAPSLLIFLSIVLFFASFVKTTPEASKNTAHQMSGKDFPRHKSELFDFPIMEVIKDASSAQETQTIKTHQYIEEGLALETIFSIILFIVGLVWSWVVGIKGWWEHG